MHPDILFQISVAIVAAAVLALVAKALRQPLIIAYVAAGIALGTTQGIGWVNAREIEPISELGLILLLFMIGLEIDLKKLGKAGKPLIATGIAQFIICVVLGLLFVPVLGYGSRSYAGLYLAVAGALSSTMIVVKLLYDKFELDTLPGRITLGILVFQDLWAILFLAVQRDLRNPSVVALGFSLLKGVALVAAAVGASRYILPRLFESVAKLPELVLIAALAWCFGISTVAAALGLSREMGALIAGVAISAFPYNLDVVAKIISLRDFFITLFFVSLGTKIPRPSREILTQALLFSAFLVISRFVAITPVLRAFRSGNRLSFLPALNLTQISEFSLVICAIGLSLGHIHDDVLSIVVFTLVITSVLSTYAILYSHEIFTAVNPVLKRLGLKDMGDEAGERKHAVAKDVVFLGFAHYASSLLQELLNADAAWKDNIGVIDFNPRVKQELDRRGIFNVYGDVSHLDTLQHANVKDAKVLVSTIPDTILKGTTNVKLLRAAKALAPQAQVITTAESFHAARDLYRAGATFVFIPRLMSMRELADVVFTSLTGDLDEVRRLHNEEIERRSTLEVLP